MSGKIGFKFDPDKFNDALNQSYFDDLIEAINSKNIPKALEYVELLDNKYFGHKVTENGQTPSIFAMRQGLQGVADAITRKVIDTGHYDGLINAINSKNTPKALEYVELLDNKYLTKADQNGHTPSEIAACLNLSDVVTAINDKVGDDTDVIGNSGISNQE